MVLEPFWSFVELAGQELVVLEGGWVGPVKKTGFLLVWPGDHLCKKLHGIFITQISSWACYRNWCPVTFVGFVCFIFSEMIPSGDFDAYSYLRISGVGVSQDKEPVTMWVPIAAPLIGIVEGRVGFGFTGNWFLTDFKLISFSAPCDSVTLGKASSALSLNFSFSKWGG